MNAIDEWNKKWRNGERADPKWVLNMMRHTRACLVDWEIAVGPYFARVRPMLVRCVGQMSASYPVPGSKLRLRVRQQKVGYLAHPVDEFDLDAEDLILTDEEVQMWELEWAMVEKVFGRADGEAVKLSAGAAVSVRVRAKQVSAGREKAVVKDRRDRAAIRAEVERLIAQGFSQKNACQEASDQAMKGRAGQHKLTAKYDMMPSVATPTVVRRLFRAKW